MQLREAVGLQRGDEVYINKGRKAMRFVALTVSGQSAYVLTPWDYERGPWGSWAEHLKLVPLASLRRKEPVDAE